MEVATNWSHLRCICWHLFVAQAFQNEGVVVHVDVYRVASVSTWLTRQNIEPAQDSRHKGTGSELGRGSAIKQISHTCVRMHTVLCDLSAVRPLLAFTHLRPHAASNGGGDGSCWGGDSAQPFTTVVTDRAPPVHVERVSHPMDHPS